VEALLMEKTLESRDLPFDLRYNPNFPSTLRNNVSPITRIATGTTVADRGWKRKIARPEALIHALPGRLGGFAG
jgi:hypothetical protein